MQSIEEFNFTSVDKIHVYGTVEEPLFKASEICDILGLKNKYSSLALISDKWKHLHTVEGKKGLREVTFTKNQHSTNL